MSIEIHTEDGRVAVCRDLRTAVNRLENWKRSDAKYGCKQRLWLVDPTTEVTRNVKHPLKRLGREVCIHGGK